MHIVDKQDPKVSEQSTPKRSHNQITSVENDKSEPSSKRIAATENVPKLTSHTAYSHSLSMGKVFRIVIFPGKWKKPGKSYVSSIPLFISKGS